MLLRAGDHSGTALNPCNTQPSPTHTTITNTELTVASQPHGEQCWGHQDGARAGLHSGTTPPCLGTSSTGTPEQPFLDAASQGCADTGPLPAPAAAGGSSAGTCSGSTDVASASTAVPQRLCQCRMEHGGSTWVWDGVTQPPRLTRAVQMWHMGGLQSNAWDRRAAVWLHHHHP